MTRILSTWLLALGLVLWAFGEARAETHPGAVALESRLYAPCCYGGTLDIHDSEVARELRSEIEERLARGETSEAIQADFVDRYGERVLAARSDRPIAAMSLSLVAVLLAAGAGLGLLMRRWVGRGAPTSRRSPKQPPPRDELDVRLDAELADLD